MSELATQSARRNSLRRWIATVREGIAAELWPLPTISILLAVILGIVLPLIDRAVDSSLPVGLERILFAGGPESARAVLSAISGSLITATSLTFSLTVVALQLASSQASPRVLRTFLKDQTVHWTLSVFVGTFAYALTVLRTVQDGDDSIDPIVPRLAVTLASLLTLASVVMLTLFLAHLARQLRIETTMRQVYLETSKTIELVASTMATGETELPDWPPAERIELSLAKRSGFIRSSDRSRLLTIAIKYDIVAREEHTVGHHMVSGTPVLRWWPRDPMRHLDDDDRDTINSALVGAVSLAYERTASQDIGFGIRQLVDITARALSPGVNDPTTAVHTLGHISATLCSIADLEIQSRGLTDDDNLVRVIIKPHNFINLLDIALTQPRRYGASDPGVVERLYQLLQEVGYRAQRTEQSEAVAAQIDRLEASVAAETYDAVERERFARFAEAARVATSEHRWL
ncbi:DUF2254 domain-containing protein [Salinibacterium sp. SWN167]|uniref:DUF2254 domain-containing protein n=1 Tax=Salinibacterium sp. SWN167 TaxID=2792054 RepID=UPI0018CF8555|nr:DUF2254 domain-containing protein [Salinibacterium sp. SWN167]MBH0082284.1 DUF2254 domain-containing protein [Salinibacterium sp. SWN167]